MEIIAKVCRKCETKKPITEFPKAKQNRDGHNNSCRSCIQKWMRGYYERTQDKAKAKGRQQYRENREARIATSRKWVEANPDRVKDNGLKYRFGITLDDYRRLLEQQDGKCAICERPDNRGKAFAVDHCHKTGVIRGLLCSFCNRALGFLKDDPNLLAKAINYLEAFK